MDFIFLPYSDEQRKHYINTEIVYRNYIEKLKGFNKSFRYRMGWNTIGNKEYLFKECYDTNKREYLGVRSIDTEKIIDAFKKQKKEKKEQLKKTKEKLLHLERLSKFYKLARTPNILVEFFRKVNELGLDDKLIVIGTNALYAYEVYASVFMEDENLATYDIDIFNKREKKLSVALQTKMPQKTIKALLLDIDKSFSKSKDAPYRFINDDNIVVEITTPTSKKDLSNDTFSGVLDLEILGTKWLERSKLEKKMVIGLNGICAYISTIRPLEYAVYKYWLGEHERKDMMKQQRDIKQSFLVTKLIEEYIPTINIESELDGIKNMSKVAIDEYREKVLRD